MATKKTANAKTTTKTTRAKSAAPKATKKAATKKAAPKKAAPAKQAKTKPAPAGDKKLSAIDAAAKVLADTKQSMNCKELIEALAAKKLWTSPGGKTPHATLYTVVT